MAIRVNEPPRSYQRRLGRLVVERSGDMFDLIRKTLLTGVGLGVMTKEKVEELATELARKADLPKKEGEALIADLLVESEKAARSLDGKVSAAVRSALEKMDVATKHDIAELEDRIVRLEQQAASENSETGSK